MRGFPAFGVKARNASYSKTRFRGGIKLPCRGRVRERKSAMVVCVSDTINEEETHQKIKHKRGSKKT